MSATRSRRWGSAILATAAAMAAIWLWARAEGPAGEVVVAGLREPVAVAALPGDQVAVADQAAASVTVYDATGAPLWSVHEGLDRPSGLCADRAGVWVADTGNHRVLLLDLHDGHELETILLGADLRPTDVAVTATGNLWISASPDGRLLLLDGDRGPLLELGEVDGVPLRAPRGLAADDHGGVFVAEALAGRVLHLDAQGRLVAALGRYGVGPGEFGKPKDVARLPGGVLAVADSQLGVLQLLGEDGTWRGLIGDATGPFAAGHTVGVAADGGRLLVADAASSVVRAVDSTHALTDPASFPEAHTLLQTASIRSADPSPLCRQCHDGTAVLSAGNWDPGASNHPWRVQGEHAMPADVSLTADGDLRCTSCHVIHHRGDEGEDPELTAYSMGRCGRCHDPIAASATEQDHRSHVTMGPLPAGADDELLRGPRDEVPTAVDCHACHAPHGAEHDRLLVAPVDGGQLCSACHAAFPRAAHPLDGDLSEAAIRTIREVGGAAGPTGNLTCTSCHDVHLAPASSLLRFGKGTDAACESCHPVRVAFHDQGEHGDEACSTCHSMHADIRPGNDHCGECHEDQGAAARRGGHGSARCQDCHPSDGEVPRPPALAEPVNPYSARCLGCHAPGAGGDAPQLASFTHPESQIIPKGTSWPAAGRIPLYDTSGSPVGSGATGEFTCGTCHATHGPLADGTAAKQLRRADWKGVCTTCHGSDGLVRYLYFHRPR